ncbi:MAG: hypothetical protein D3923_14330, partial [Candidatus Electrothrix sp. AR3]|nr:hypothetical protein [Candidatus Electrothrix sp. AR3]
MYSTIREITSGLGAACIFLVLILLLNDLESTLWLAFGGAVGSYFGIRFSFQKIRENIFGMSAAGIFFLLVLLGMDGRLGLPLAVGSYFGIRSLFRPGLKKIALPEGISREAFKEYISRCKLALSLVREDAETVKNISFQRTVLHLCDLGDDLVINFEKDPEDIRIAQALPDRLQRLHQMLAAYIDLAHQKNQSPQTTRALEAT